jgi:hypothetical protein
MRLLLPSVAILAAVGTPARADDPSESRVLTAPTAWLPPAGGVVVTTTLDHRFDGSAVIGYSLGGLAAIDVGTDADVRTCETCDGDAEPLFLGRAGFRMGLRQDQVFRGSPALLVGVRTTFANQGRVGDVKVSEAYLVASRTLGPVKLHAGVQAVDAAMGEVALGVKVRPIGGLEWTPGQYPNTTVLADLAYVPLLRHGAGDVDLEWVGGVGVRYNALRDWGAIELAVRVREDEGLGDTTVMVRLNGVLDPAHPFGKKN